MGMNYAPPGYAPPPGYGQPPMGQPPYQQSGVASPDGQSEITERTAQIMHQTKGWTTFLSVLGFVGVGFMLLGGFACLALGAATGNFQVGMMGVLYLPMAALYVYPTLKLWGYGKAVGVLLTTRKDADLEAALDQQRAFWRFLGIMTIVMMVLYALALVISVASGVFIASMAR